ncbi:MAG: hypothetical protein IPQ12_04195 [Polaromonas sp.]|nr:hypothetical protein [Polaromonas sp.]
MAVHRLLAPILKDDHIHLICQDGEFDDLIADLATHKLDLVLADHAPALSLNFKVQHQKRNQLYRGTPLHWLQNKPLSISHDLHQLRSAPMQRWNVASSTGLQADLINPPFAGKLKITPYPLSLPTKNGVCRATQMPQQTALARQSAGCRRSNLVGTWRSSRHTFPFNNNVKGLATDWLGGRVGK